MSPRKDAEYLAKHLARHGAASTGGDGLDQYAGPPPSDGWWVLPFSAGWSFLGFLLGLVLGLPSFGILCTTMVFGVASLAFGRHTVAGARSRQAQDAAEARAIREAETERQMAEFKASGGWKGSKAP